MEQMWVFFFCLLWPQTVQRTLKSKCLLTRPFELQEAYHRPGDYLVGGILPYIKTTVINASFQESPKNIYILRQVPKNYQHILALVFAINEINKDPMLLPNITLGFHIFEDTRFARMTYQAGLSFLSLGNQVVPNYRSSREEKLLSVIGSLSPEISVQMASLLGLFKIPQLGYGSFNPVLKERTIFPSFYQIDPNEDPQYLGIILLLLHFHWNWIGIVAPDDDSSENFIQALTPMLDQNNICVEFTERTLSESSIYHTVAGYNKNLATAVLEGKANVVLIFGDSNAIRNVIFPIFYHKEKNKVSIQKIWIVMSQWEFAAVGFHFQWTALEVFHGALSFRGHTSEVPGFHSFLQSLDPRHPQGDVFLKEWWKLVFKCLFKKPGDFPVGFKNCTEKEDIEKLPPSVFEMSMTGNSYNVYNAIYSLAHALHAMYTLPTKRRMQLNGKSLLDVHPWQVTSSVCYLPLWYQGMDRLEQVSPEGSLLLTHIKRTKQSNVMHFMTTHYFSHREGGTAVSGSCSL